MKIPSVDVIIVHSYWLSQRKDKIIELSFRGKKIVEAAAYLYKNSSSHPFILITGGKIWGNEYLSLSQLAKKELIEKYNIPQEKIIIKDEAFDTNEEIDVSLQIIKDKKWTTAIDLAWKKHFWTISLLYKVKGFKPNFISVEEILPQQTKQFTHSIYEFNYFLYILLIRLALIFDPEYKLLGKSAKTIRGKKGNFGLPFLPADKYSL